MKFITVVLGLVSLCQVITALAPTTTGTFRATTPGQCDIRMKAAATYITFTDVDKNSYIIVNGLAYVDSFVTKVACRGFNLVALDPTTCKGTFYDHYDTWASSPEADRLASYIYTVKDGTHILGVTIDDGFAALNPGARNALKSIGVDTTGLVYADKLIFHAVKGHPDKAIVKLHKSYEPTLYYEEHGDAAPCDLCQNDGELVMNADGTGFECSCTGNYAGTYCELFQ